MTMRRKLAAAILVAGTVAGGLVAAAPANATVTQSGCKWDSVVINALHQGSAVGYCFNGTGDAVPEPDLPAVLSFFSHTHVGTFSYTAYGVPLTNYTFGINDVKSYTDNRTIWDLYLVH